MLARHGRGRLHLGTAALLTALLINLTAAAAPAQGNQQTELGQRIAVPAYFYPGGDGAALWQRLSTNGVGIAVANPFSGPGKTRDPKYSAAIDTFSRAGVKVLGYVATGYLGTTGRATRLGETTPAAWFAQVQQEIETWYRLYGEDGLAGIFFDEVQNVCGPEDSYIRDYRALDADAKRRHRGAFTVINPGIDTEPCDAADVILTFEGTYDTYRTWQPPAWHRSLDPQRLWHLVHATATEAQLADAVALSKERRAGYLYVTPDVLANPWDSLPPASYWDAQLAAARAVNDTTAPRLYAKPVPLRVSSTEATLAWLPAWGAGRLAGYDVLVDGIRVTGTRNALPLATVSGLLPGQSYVVSVIARDEAGNASAPGRTVTIRASAADGIVPEAPAGLAATETKVASVRLTWTVSTAPDLAAYDVSLNGQPLLSLPPWLAGTPVSVPISGLEPGTAYAFTVAARDTSGNVSPAAGPLSVTTTLPSGDPISDASGALTATGATYQAQFNLPFDFHHVFIDADANEATGFGTAGIGADLLIENGWFYRHSGTGWSWVPVDGPSPLVSSTGDVFVWQVPAAVLAEIAGAPGLPHRIVFHGAGSSPEAYTPVLSVS